MCYHNVLKVLTNHRPIAKKLGIVIPKIPRSKPISKYPKTTLKQSLIVFLNKHFIIRQIMKRITILVGIDTANAIRLLTSALNIPSILIFSFTNI